MVNRLTERFGCFGFLLGKRRLGTVCFLIGFRSSLIAFQLFSYGRLFICLLCRTPVRSRDADLGASLGRRAFFRLCDRRVFVGLTFFLQGLSHCFFHDDFTLCFRRHFLCHGFTVSLVLLRLRDNASLKVLICSSTEC